MIPLRESGNTRLFTWPRSFEPDGDPHLTIVTPGGTVIHSATAIASGSGFLSFITMPLSTGIYLFEWLAQQTLVGSTYNFIDRGLFKVHQTLAGGFGG